jgi:DNA-binding response OmpR family regulator
MTHLKMEADVAGLQKILLAEDNISLQKIYNEYLNARGYVVMVAGDGNQTLETAKTFEPQLIFMDVMMPGVNGFDVVTKLRRDPTYNCVRSRIVLLTNLGRDKVPANVIELIDGYALKAEIELVDLVNIINSFDQA